MSGTSNVYYIGYHRHICEECGKEFFSKGTIRIILCPMCKKIRNAEMAKEVYILHKKRENPYYIPNNEKNIVLKKNKKIKTKSIQECVKIIEKYNKEHNTCYTYGRFPFPELLR